MTKSLTPNEIVEFKPEATVPAEPLKSLVSFLRREFGYTLEPKAWNWGDRQVHKGIIDDYIVQMGISKSASSTFAGYIGGFLGANRISDETYYFRLSPTLDWKSGDFGDAGSCAFSDGNEMMPTLQHNKCFAIQFLNKAGKGIGRVLAMELEGVWILFNAYGRMYENQDMAPSVSATKSRQDNKVSLCAALMAQYLDLDCKRVSLKFNGDVKVPVFVNGEFGYLVGDRASIRLATEMDIPLDLNIDGRCPRCKKAGLELFEVEAKYTGYDRLCNRCRNLYMLTCVNCGKMEYSKKATWISDGNGYYCSPKCASESGCRQCACCGDWKGSASLQWVESERKWYCVSCYKEYIRTCVFCMKTFITKNMRYVVPKGRTSEIFACRTCGDNLKMTGNPRGEEK